MNHLLSRPGRLAILVSLVASASLPVRAAHAETSSPAIATSTTTEALEARDTAATGTGAPPAPLGVRGSRALGFAIDLGAANSGVATRPLGMGGRVSLDSFVVEGLSIGGQFGFEYATVDGSFYNVGGGPRLGYALRLGDKLALWPMVLLTYDSGTVPQPGGSGAASLQDVRVGAHLPLVMTLGGQVAFELGPLASTDLWRSVDGQSAAHMDLIGLRTGLVGWF